VNFVDENVGNGALAGQLSQSILNSRPILNLIELDGIEAGAEFRKKLLGLSAVRTVRLAEDGDSVVVDDALSLGLCGRHGCWAVGALEEVAKE